MDILQLHKIFIIFIWLHENVFDRFLGGKGIKLQSLDTVTIILMTGTGLRKMLKRFATKILICFYQTGRIIMCVWFVWCWGLCPFSQALSKKGKIVLTAVSWKLSRLHWTKTLSWWAQTISRCTAHVWPSSATVMKLDKHRPLSKHVWSQTKTKTQGKSQQQDKSDFSFFVSYSNCPFFFFCLLIKKKLSHLKQNLPLFGLSSPHTLSE